MHDRNRTRLSAARMASSFPEMLFERLEDRTLLSADLTVTLTGAAATLNASTGGVVQLTGSVRNLGDVGADGFVTRLAISRDTTYDIQDTLLSFIQNHGSGGLSPGESLSLNGPLTIPAGLAPGTYYIVAVTDFNDVIDEGNEENNAAATARPTVILNGPSNGPNLTATVVATSTGGVNPEGGTFSAVATLRNTVVGTTVGAFTIRWVLSLDSVIGNSDDLMLREEIVTPVGGFGGSVTMTVGADFELDEMSGGAAGYVAAGSYRVGVVVDSAHAVSERNEGDNRASSSGSIRVARPDLTGTFTYTGGTFSPGQVLRGTLTLRNLSVTAAEEFSLRVLLEPAAGGEAIEILDIPVLNLAGDFQHEGLGGHETRTLSNLQVPLPFAVVPGAYRVRVVIDYGDNVTESDEGNNSTLSSSANVVVPPRNIDNDPLYNEVLVWGARVSGTFAPGGSVGTALIGSSLNGSARLDILRLLLSTDSIPSDDDIELDGVYDFAPDHWSDSSSLYWGSVIIPIDTPGGVYRLLAVVEEDSPEGNQADNVYELTGPAGLRVVLPTVSVVAVDSTAAEGTGSATTGRFRFTRTGSLTGPLEVFFNVGGTAEYGSDYTGIGEVVTIPAGSSSVTVDVTAIDDVVGELAETVTVTPYSPRGQTYVVTTGAARTATVTISDNESSVRVAATDATAAEPGGTTATRGMFTFTRSGGSTAAALVVYYSIGGTADGGSDYEPLSGTVTIPAGAAFVTLPLLPMDDSAGEGNETVVVTLSSHETYRLAATAAQRVGQVTIADNEPLVRIAVVDAVASERPNPIDRASFRISRDGPTTGELVVRFAVTGGTAISDDFALGAEVEGTEFEWDDITGEGSVTIPAGRSSVTVILHALLDLETEAQETAVLGLLAGSGPGQTYQRSATTSTATARINSVTYTDLGVSLDDSTIANPQLRVSDPSQTIELPVRFTNRGNTAIDVRSGYLFLERANGSRIQFSDNIGSILLLPGQSILVTAVLDFAEGMAVAIGSYRLGLYASTIGDGQPSNNTIYWTTMVTVQVP